MLLLVVVVLVVGAGITVAVLRSMYGDAVEVQANGMFAPIGPPHREFKAVHNSLLCTVVGGEWTGVPQAGPHDGVVSKSACVAR